MSTNLPVVVITPEELLSMVKAVVTEVFGDQRNEITPALLDRVAAARFLGVGTSTIDRLRREGLPCIMIGDSPRFEGSACLEWLRQHHGQCMAGAPADTAGSAANETTRF